MAGAKSSEVLGGVSLARCVPSFLTLARWFCAASLLSEAAMVTSIVWRYHLKPLPAMLASAVSGPLAMAIMPLASTAALVTWLLLIVAGVGLLLGRRWGFVAVYLAFVLNIFGGLFSFIPCTYPVAFQIMPPSIGIYLVLFGVNGAFVVLVIQTQVALRTERKRLLLLQTTEE